MIKFFRKIRQNLLSAGKTGQYLKYAIGEILLVVIGILIALQINNWNENRKKAEAEKQYLNNLIQDIKNDQVFYESRASALNLVSEIYDNFITIMEKDDFGNFSQDSLPMPFALGSGFAYESSVIKNNPDYRLYISSPEILTHLKGVFFTYEYLEKAFIKYNEMNMELGTPLDILAYKNTGTIDQIPTYGDFINISNAPNTIGVLSVFNKQNQNTFIQLDKFRNALDELFKVSLEWQKSNDK